MSPYASPLVTGSDTPVRIHALMSVSLHDRLTEGGLESYRVSDLSELPRIEGQDTLLIVAPEAAGGRVELARFLQEQADHEQAGRSESLPVVVWDPGASRSWIDQLEELKVRGVVTEMEIGSFLQQLDEILHPEKTDASADHATRPASRSAPPDPWVEEGSRPPSVPGMVSQSPRMFEIFTTIRRVAATRASVLILGETGTGKELIAQALHDLSGRTGMLVPVNCAAIPEHLVDAQLFGHEKGSFTGAEASKRGLFRTAQGGTIFLDEVGNMPVPVQFSLLRVLQESRVRPVGSSHEIEVDVRVVSATSIPLETAIEYGQFRADLFYRLDIIRVLVPPLRERPEDIPLLFQTFIRQHCESYGIRPPLVDPAFSRALQGYHWPGNVRQLKNLVERLVLTVQDRTVTVEDFHRLDRSVDSASVNRSGRVPESFVPPTAPPTGGPPPRADETLPGVSGEPSSPAASAAPPPPPAPVGSTPSPAPAAAPPPLPPASGVAVPSDANPEAPQPPPQDLPIFEEWLARMPIDLERGLDDHLDLVIAKVERRYLVELLKTNSGRIGVTADQANISRRTFLRKMKLYGLDKSEYKG